MYATRVTPHEESSPRPKEPRCEVVNMPRPPGLGHEDLYAAIESFSMDEPGTRLTFAARLAELQGHAAVAAESTEAPP